MAMKSQDVLNGKHLLEQLRDVFDACDTDGQGFISLKELANISKSHVSRGHVDQILEIFDPGDVEKDQIDFDEFYLKYVEYMRNGVRIDNDNGVFNENLKRAFAKDDDTFFTKSTSTHRRSSQVKQSGRIPLVNTSSEDDADDSFDRKIASSLALARPMDIQSQFLVRGSYVRSTVRRTSNTSPTNNSTSSRRYSIASKTSPTSITRMSPILSPSEGSSYNSLASTTSPSHTREESPISRLAFDELECKALVTSDTGERQLGCDSESSGLGSGGTDFEEEVNSSIIVARKCGENRLEVEKVHLADYARAMEKEQDLERKNFQLRFEQFEEEQVRLKEQLDDLKCKLKSVNLEKDNLEDQVVNLEDEKKIFLNKHKDIEEKRKDREEVLSNTVQKLTSRIQTLDQDLAESKEDNLVLRSQVNSLKAGKVKGLINKFGGGKGATGSVQIDEYDDDPNDIRVQLKAKEKELDKQVQVHKEIKQYLDKVLSNVMAMNPQLLEKSLSN